MKRLTLAGRPGLAALLAACALWAFAVPIAFAAEPVLEVWSSEGCPVCGKARAYLDELQQRMPQLRIVIHDVDRDRAALERFLALSEANGVTRPGVPSFLVGRHFEVGWDGQATAMRLEALLSGKTLPPVQGPAVTSRVFGDIDAGRLGLPLFTAVLGLLDGFNPCAMWVLVFVLSLLVNLKDRRKMLLIGGTFVFASGLVYFAFMAAWLNVFLLVGVSRITQAVLGAIAIVIGLINVKDFFAFGRGISIGIPESAKPGIYARVRRVLSERSTGAALGSVFVLALMVNTVELLCTSGLPAIYTQVLAASELPAWGYYGYLALYNAFYMLDDSLLLATVVITLRLTRLQERGGRILKLVSGLVMLALGLILAFRPQWLDWSGLLL